MTVAPFQPIAAEIVENALLGGRVRLRQPAKGYRAGMDAALLAAAVAAAPGERVIEAGCGAGAVLMQIAARCPGVSLTGLERDPAMAALARENATLNGADAQIVEGDVAAGFRALDLPLFDRAVSNPPFFDDPAALRAPAEGKRGAWMADDGLKAWTTFLLKSVREGGRIAVIHRADRLADLAIAPVVTLLPASVHGNVKIETAAGRKVVVCPATYRDDVNCKSCGLCQKSRDVIVGFPAHGARKGRIAA